MIRVLVAEDMHLLREALVGVLRLEDDIDVVAELDRGDQIIGKALETVPDVALVDADLPGTDGLTTAARLKELLPRCRILVVTGLARPGNIRRAMEAGAAGFLLKDTPLDQLVTAIRRVATGERVMTEVVARTRGAHRVLHTVCKGARRWSCASATFSTSLSSPGMARSSPAAALAMVSRTAS